MSAAALITIGNGRVQQATLTIFPAWRSVRRRAWRCTWWRAAEFPGRVGETGTACIAAALCNAVFAASGRRVRTLPVRGGLKA